jgi:hypothetical protein
MNEGEYSPPEMYRVGIRVRYNGNQYTDFHHLDHDVDYIVVRPVGYEENTERLTISGENVEGWVVTHIENYHWTELPLSLGYTRAWNASYKNFIIIDIISEQCLKCKYSCFDAMKDCPLFEER